MSPLKTPLSDDIFSSIFFEFGTDVEEPNEKLACVEFILWQRLSCLNVYPNVSLLRRHSNSSSKSSNSIKKLIRRLSRKKKIIVDNDVAVLSLPGLTSSAKDISDADKEVKAVKPVPLSSSLLLLNQTRNLLSPEGAWYYDYIDNVSCAVGFSMRLNTAAIFVCILVYALNLYQ